jgi:hypothetical protein
MLQGAGRNRRQYRSRESDAFGSTLAIKRILLAALRQLGRRIRKTLSAKHSNNELPLGHGHRSQVLASHLSGVRGASMVWCSLDGELLVPIVYAHDHGTEIIGLGCMGCGEFVPTPAGVL